MNTLLKSLSCIAILASLTIALPANATKNSAPADIDDPFEPFNRTMHGFNTGLGNYVFDPLISGYRFVVPEVGRERVSSFASNLGEPVIFLNSIFQGDVDRSFTSFWRFIINSTFGIAGIFDVATIAGLEYRKEDFGQTLGVHGLGAGPYLVLPVIGPSSGRDAFGLIVDIFLDPFNYLVEDEALYALNAVEAVSAYDSIYDLKENVESSAIDPYATFRSLYYQRRQSMITNHK